jgi:hypothetical protein
MVVINLIDVASCIKMLRLQGWVEKRKSDHNLFPINLSKTKRHI